MNFDRVAPHYLWLETLAFGDKLQEARTAFVRHVETPRRVLIVGEGNGRFLSEFVRWHPAAEVDCIEASGRMIELARAGFEAKQVHFIRALVSEVELDQIHYDLVVTHFVLDCFDEETLPPLLAKLAQAATADASWLIADFCVPPRGWRRLGGRWLISLMYLFFRLVAGLETKRLVDYRPLLRANGFALKASKSSPNDIVRSEWWRR
ncbi:MAG TPA: class I SAM-dependent methyltransferase [Chthoniobacterales bacterium]